MTIDKYDVESCYDVETNEFDWDLYQALCDMADYWSDDEE